MVAIVVEELCEARALVASEIACCATAMALSRKCGGRLLVVCAAESSKRADWSNAMMAEIVIWCIGMALVSGAELLDERGAFVFLNCVPDVVFNDWVA